MADDMKMGEAKLDGSEAPPGDMLVEAQADGEETAGEGTGVTEHRNGVADINGGGNGATGDEVSFFVSFPPIPVSRVPSMPPKQRRNSPTDPGVLPVSPRSSPLSTMCGLGEWRCRRRKERKGGQA